MINHNLKHIFGIKNVPSDTYNAPQKSDQKKYDAQIKAKLALELVSGKKTLIEICTEHKIPKTTLIEWKEKLEKESHDIFLPISERDKRLKHQVPAQINQLFL